MIKKEYAKLRAKHNLPRYGELNNIFELDLLESDKLLLRQIKRKIKKKFDDVASFIIPLLQPEATDFISIQEYHCCSEKQRAELLQVLKRIMILERKYTETTFLLDDKKDALFIRQAFKEWKSSNVLVGYAVQLQEYWKRDDDKRPARRYLG
jgi:hypothetical protein